MLDNPFLSPEFSIAVGRQRPRARVAVLSEGAEIVGFFPFERRRLGVGVPIAAGFNDCHGLVHAPGLDWSPGELLEACGLSMWEFDHLVDRQCPFEPYLARRRPSPTIELAGGFDTYHRQLRARSSRFRADLPRRRRMLAREVGEPRFVFAEPDGHLLDTVLAWKSAQYVRTGAADLFSRPWLARLLDELYATDSDGFAGVLSMLYAGDTPIAGHFQLRFDGVLAGWFPAYDPRFGKYAPGLQHHLDTARVAASAGIRHIELGKGAMGYKELLANGERVVGEGRVVRSRALAALRTARRTPVRRLRAVVVAHPPLHHLADRVRRRHSALDSALRHGVARLGRS
jgi:CelD/BcsL family acetyltransferase involved in cellulose biosynthesis